MNEELASVIKLAIIGLTVTVSMIVLAVTRVITSKRKRELADDQQRQIEDRLTRIESAIDAVATEVERVAAEQQLPARRLDAPDERR